MKKKQEKMQDKDLFSISKGSRRGMVVFLVLMTLIWMIPIYSLVKDSLKVNGIQNYVYVLTNKINGVPFYRYFMNSAINAVGASLLLVLICSFAGFAFSKIEFTGRKWIYSMVVM